MPGVLILAFILSQCAPAVHVEQSQPLNLNRYKTYKRMETQASQTDSRNVSAFGEQTVHNVASQELPKLGLHEVTHNPDLWVTHDVLVQRRTQQQSDPGYNQLFTRFYYNPYLRRWGMGYYPTPFLGYDTYTVPVREGTLTLTLRAANTDKAKWQAGTTEQLDSRRFTTQELEKSVRNVLKKLKAQANTANSTAGNTR